jgi:two-component system, OmpR family, alkaline phosphatase synthesis response regulator PhoP
MFDNYAYLYVEDDPSSREIMQILMENAMDVHSLTIFDNSADFIEHLRLLPHVPDVILLDIHVAPHDGFKMLTLLRADSVYRDAKVIAVTASVMNEEVTKLRTSGFDGAIAKPLSVQTFPEMIRRVLAGEAVWHIV